MFTLLLFCFWLLTLFQDNQFLSPKAIAIITALFGIAVAGIGWQYLKDKVNGSSRALNLLGACLAAYGMLQTYLDTFPRWLALGIAGIGVVLTLFNSKLQGPSAAK
jgi:formate hydrogenlyase subunit 3/multisubunit Na+/H+ antiporter MnhD subunit